LSALVLQSAFLGDTILTTSLIAELAARGAVDVLVTPQAAPVLTGNPAIRDVIVYDKRGADAGASGFLRLASRLRSRAYGNAYLAQASWRSAALAWRAGIPNRVGFVDAPGRRLYTSRVPRLADRHQAERLWRLAFPEGGEPDTMPPLAMHPGPDDKAAVDALLGGGRNAPLVVLAPGSQWATKRWPYFEKLALEISGEVRLAVVGGPDDVSAAQIIHARVPDTIIAAGRLSLLGSAELIRRARVVVANDSSPTHMASAMGTPTLTVFGPTTAGFGFGPLAPRAMAVQHDAMPCRPCHHHGPRRCPLGHWRCMTQLASSRVAAAVREIIAGPRPG
jgi:heptosyltransferase-2